MRRFAIAIFITFTLPANAQQSATTDRHQHPSTKPDAGDTRQLVSFPTAMREHTLANMRDHLLALQEIQAALSTQKYDIAADVAEQRLGLSSLGLHGAHEVAKYMPIAMQDTGTAMHKSASRFVIASHDAAATGDVKPALAALAEITGACVACHAGFRLN